MVLVCEDSRTLLIKLALVAGTFFAVNGVEPPSPDDSSRRQEPPQGPVFISEPPATVIFPNTAGAWIPCSAFGRPAPVLDWVRTSGEDGEDVPVDDVPHLLTIMPNNTLHFHPFSEASYRPDVHSTSLRCLASNSAGSVISRQVTVKAVLLKQYKTFNIRANDVYVTRGGTAALKCSINPYYVREYVDIISWTRGGKQVISNGKFSVLSSGELYIREAVEEDSYVLYRCIVKNRLTGETKESDPATLYIIEPVTSPPSLENTMTTMTVRQGSTAELPCTASGYPLPTYTWTKDGVRISTEQDRVTQRGGNLLIQNVMVRDSGAYICKASNSMGKKRATINLTVTAPLSAYIEPPQQTVDVGRSAQFNCTVYGHPVSAIRWYKDGKPLVSDSRITMVTARSLKIVSVQRQDKGMYQCLVSNDKENAQGSAQLSLGSAVPYIFQAFEDQYVKPGTRISLKCIAAGNPLPSFRWTLDDGPIPLDDRFSVGQATTPEGEVISFINITNLKVQDGGQYKCTAANMAGSGSHVGKINIFGLPYIRPMTNVTAVAGEILAIRCHVSGYPIHTISWLKDEASLPTNHRQQVGRDGTLTVRNVDRSHDDGEYVCDARNSAGQGMRRSVIVHIQEPPRIDSFQFPAKKQGDRVSVSCVVSSGDLPITISWRKNGREIPHDHGVVVQKTGAYSSLLSIGHASPRHNGNYTCIATNNAAVKNYTAELHVDVPPRWVVEPQDTYVVLGEAVTMDCQTSGDPVPNVIWKKARGDQPGDYSSINSTSLSDGRPHIQQLANGSLRILKAKEEDDGYYLCHSSNGIGAGLSKVVEITVHIPARFVQREKNYTVHEGSNITMECVAQGDRPLSVAWSFNGGGLNWQYNGRLQVSHFNLENGRGSRLTIKPTNREDTGFYVCNAKNIFGSDAITIRLLVLEPPEAPVDLKIRSGTSRSIQLGWHPSFDGNSPVTQYIVQYKNASAPWAQPIKEVLVTREEATAVISDLHPASSYTFRIVAQNAIGLSHPSDEITFSTREEAPSGVPRDVQILPLGSKSLRITWSPPSRDQRNGDIQGYYIGYKKFNTSAPYMYVTKAVAEDFVPEAIIENLDKFTRYSVHVQAYNAKGAGPRTEDTDVLTLEDVPSQAPMDVQATPLSSQSVMIVWSPPPLYTLHGILQGYKVLYKPVRDDEDETDAMSMETSKLTAALYGLRKFTNYSIQVLAYTRRGEGVRSPAIHVRTQPDIPDRPADIKALAAGPTSILVTWRPPVHPNGVLLKYILHMQDVSMENNIDEILIDLPASQLSHLLTNLSMNHEYRFQVGAATVVGAGDLTHIVEVATVEKVTASIASFSMVLYAHWQNDVILPCQAVGTPAPSVSWKKRGEALVGNERIHVFDNGSLWISDLQGKDAANYTCRAQNDLGADEIQITLVVQAPPKQPVLTVAASTKSTIQVKWRSGSNGGSKLQGFTLYYKREHTEWEEVTLGPQNRSYVANNLRCGTKYFFHMRAFNKVGEGVPSESVHAKTNGSAPIMPAQSLILEHINSTFVLLALHTWQSGGCPITSYDIEYQYWGDSKWETVESHIDPEKAMYKVDVRPETWYIMRVTAHNDAGSTECILKFPTKTYEGSTIQPLRIVHRYEQRFYEKIYIMVPLCAFLVFVIIIIVAVGLYCKRRSEELKYKAQNASNLRRDLTAETSLMSDGDKNTNGDRREAKGSDYTLEPTRQLNVNLLAAGLTNKERTMDDTSSWVYQGSNKGSRSSQSSNSGSDGNINPYATFPHGSEGDHAPNNQELRELPPPPPELLEGGIHYQNSNFKEGPQHYGSVEALSASHLAHRPGDNTYPLVLHRTLPSRAGQRLSMVSNVSSNQEELTRALDPHGPRPPPPPERDSSRPATGASDASDPDLRYFTQSPARPNEHRQAICEMPIYGGAHPSQGYATGPFNRGKVLPLAQQIMSRQGPEPGHSRRRSPPPLPGGQETNPRFGVRVPPKPPPRRSPPSSGGSSPGEETQRPLPSGSYAAVGEDSPLVGDIVIPEQQETDEPHVGLLSGSRNLKDEDPEDVTTSLV